MYMVIVPNLIENGYEALNHGGEHSEFGLCHKSS
jgi:hypothetical protein